MMIYQRVSSHFPVQEPIFTPRHCLSRSTRRPCDFHALQVLVAKKESPERIIQQHGFKHCSHVGTQYIHVTYIHMYIYIYMYVLIYIYICEQLNPCSGYVVWSITRSLALPSPAFQESMAESCGLFFAALGS